MKNMSLFLALALLCNAHALDAKYFGSFYLLDTKSKGDYFIEKSTFGDDLNFQNESLIGANIYHNLNKQVSFHGQVISLGQVRGDRWNVEIDYAFLTYNISKKFQINFGRQIFPAWMTSPYTSVGYLLPAEKLPYVVSTVSYFNSINGVSFDYKYNDNISIKPFVGQELENVKLEGVTTDNSLRMKYENVYGLELRYSPFPEFVFHSTLYYTELTASAEQSLLDAIGDINTGENRVFSSGFHYEDDYCLTILEYGRSDGEDVDGLDTRVEVGYFLFGKKWESWLFHYYMTWSQAAQNDSQKPLGHQLGFNYTFDENIKYKMSLEDRQVNTVKNSVHSYRMKMGVDFVF